MKIQKITYQNRRDFQAVYVCEGCGNTVESSGYDDSYFHENVIPQMKCKKCGKTSAECNANYRPFATKYADSDVV